MNYLWALLVLAFLLVGSPSSNAQTNTTNTTTTNTTRVVGYYLPQEKGLPVAQIDGSKLTHLLYAFGNPSDTGEVTLKNKPGQNLADLERIAISEQVSPEDKTCRCGLKCLNGYINQFLKLKKQYPHVKQLLSIGGWSFSTNFSASVSTPENRSRFVKTSTDLMVKYGFDGIDLDWEFPSIKRTDAGSSPDDWENLLRLCTEFKAYWKANVKFPEKKELSIALPASRATSGKFLTDSTLREFSNTVNFFLLMAYEYHHGATRTRYGAPLRSAPSDNQQETIENASAGVSTYTNIIPTNKLVLGVPLYGMGYTGFDPSTSRRGEPPCFGSTGKLTVVEPQPYTTLFNWATSKQFGYDAPVIDTKRIAAVICNGTHMYSFDTTQTFKVKAEYVMEQGLGGIMIWDLAQDFPSDNSGMGAVTSVLSISNQTIYRPEDICIPGNDEFCNWKCDPKSRLLSGRIVAGDDISPNQKQLPPSLLDGKNNTSGAASVLISTLSLLLPGIIAINIIV